jgi:hypothetical protein
VCNVIVLFEFACLIRHGATQKERKTISLEDKCNVLWDVDKYTRTFISSVKQLRLSVSSVNMMVTNNHVIEADANQCGKYFLKK